MKSVTPAEQAALLAGLQFLIEQLDIQIKHFAAGDEWNTDFLLGVEAVKLWIVRVYLAIEAS